jgi:sulfate permease, SulP family
MRRAVTIIASRSDTRSVIRRSLRYVNELPEAIQKQLALAYTAKDLLAYGLRERLREGYSVKDFRADLLAALVVGIVALPLSMALAIACEVPPQHGLYTAIIAGFVCSLLGGTRMQVTGPTAAFVVILVPIVHKFGLGGLLMAGMLAGILLIAMGLARLGKLMQFVPHPVTTGFTMGIAIVIGLLQLKDVFGVRLPRTEGTFEYLGALWDARAAINPYDVGIAVVTIALLLVLPKVLRRIPAPLVALSAVALLVVLCERVWPGFHASTIGNLDKFSFKIGNEIRHGIPPLPPIPMVPWNLDGVSFDYHTIRELLPSAFAIAMLGAIESLMAAVIADGMSGTRHDPNAELIALGIGNILCPFFGGIAATGALARTATNIRAGARSPFSAAMHAVFILACTIVLAPLVAYLPMAALAGLLIIVARNMSEARHFTRLLRIAARSDVIVMLTCFMLTVVFDMVIAVTVGVVLAALLFMRRMAITTTVALESPQVHGLTIELPPGVRLYEVAGPMFFGAAKSAMEAIAAVGNRNDHTVVLNMQYVPTIDVTGLVALESALDRLYRSRIKVILAGLLPEVADLLERAGIKREPGRLAYAPDLETALSLAIVHAARLRRTAETPTAAA